jgi:diadenosine tetraphosphate (Ap4A) HIT family hydrolase
MSFSLHPALKKDCIELGQLELCRVLLMNDSQFPWLILVPKRELFYLFTLSSYNFLSMFKTTSSSLSV